MKKYLKKHDIILLSPSEWTDNAVSNMHIAVHLSRNNRVIYFETIGGRFPRISEIGRVIRRILKFIGINNIKSKRQGLDPEKVKIKSPLALPIFGSKIIDKINNLILILQIKKIIKDNNFKNPIIWCFSPRWIEVIKKINKNILIFHCVDALFTYDKSNKFINQLNELTQMSDLVLTPGILLEKDFLKKKIHVRRIPHGCSFEHLKAFKQKRLKIPNEYKEIKGPKLIYVGTLANWVNYDLLIYVAKKIVHCNLILIGYIHTLAPIKKIQQLINLPNVHHLGFKSFSKIPSYINHSNVCLVPYDSKNEHIRYYTPTKFLDYLASGLPIVSTKFPDTNTYKNLIYTSDDKSQYVKYILKALNENYKESKVARQNYATNNTWDKQIRSMEYLVYEIMRKQNNENF